jgi:hypothetical protein
VDFPINEHPLQQLDPVLLGGGRFTVMNNDSTTQQLRLRTLEIATGNPLAFRELAFLEAAHIGVDLVVPGFPRESDEDTVRCSFPPSPPPIMEPMDLQSPASPPST